MGVFVGTLKNSFFNFFLIFYEKTNHFVKMKINSIHCEPKTKVDLMRTRFFSTQGYVII